MIDGKKIVAKILGKTKGDVWSKNAVVSIQKGGSATPVKTAQATISRPVPLTKKLDERPAPAPRPSMANPAAKLAVSMGLPYKIVTKPDGSQSGVVTMKGNREIDEWAFYRLVNNPNFRR